MVCKYFRNSPKIALCQVWLKLTQYGSGEDFLNITYIVSLLRKLSLLGKKSWIPFTQGCFVPSLVDIYLMFMEKIFLYVHYFEIISPWKRNKLEFSLPEDDLCQVWLTLAQWFWRRRFLNFVNVFFLEKLFPFGKGCDPSFEQTWIPST